MDTTAFPFRVGGCVEVTQPQMYQHPITHKWYNIHPGEVGTVIAFDLIGHRTEINIKARANRDGHYFWVVNEALKAGQS